MTIERTPIPHQEDEVTTLRAFLDYYRDTIRVKTDGLDQEQLGVALAPSDLTLGGMLKHLACVETWWFAEVLDGDETTEPFASADWEADEDWDWHSAVDDAPDQLRGLFDTSIVRSEQVLDGALARGGLDLLSVGKSHRTKEPFKLRWILVHMIEEYARHAGHADLIRQSIDGQVGD